MVLGIVDQFFFLGSVRRLQVGDAFLKVTRRRATRFGLLLQILINKSVCDRVDDLRSQMRFGMPVANVDQPSFANREASLLNGLDPQRSLEIIDVVRKALGLGGIFHRGTGSGGRSWNRAGGRRFAIGRCSESQRLADARPG